MKLIKQFAGSFLIAALIFFTGVAIIRILA